MTKSVVAGIDVYDYINVTADPDGIVKLIKSRFSGRCYGGSFIVEVGKIILMSDLVINTHGSSAFATMSVAFEAKVLVYEIGDVIVGLQIRSRESGDMLVADAVNKPVSAIIFRPAKYASMQKGDIVLGVVSSQPTYAQNSETIGVLCEDFKFPAKVMAFRLTSGSLSGALADNLAELLGENTKALAAMAETNSKGFAVMKKLLYAYKTEVSPPQGAEVLELGDLLEPGAWTKWGRPGVVLVRDSRLDKFTPQIYAYEPGAELPSNYMVCGVSVDVAMTAIASNFARSVLVLSDMLEIYKGEAVMNNKAMMVVVRQAKLDA